jgi:mannose-6-phosphate isomerase-like protein (cupin superfamily)
MIQHVATSTIQRLRAADVQVTGDPDLCLDRYLIDSSGTGGAVSVVEHVLPPKALAAPVHRHSREDEYSIVLTGLLGVMEDDEEIVAEAGDVVFKPRGRWHTFWNAGDVELRLLEVITPGGIENLFRMLADPKSDYDPEKLPALAASYGCDVDFERTMPLVERLNLRF